MVSNLQVFAYLLETDSQLSRRFKLCILMEPVDTEIKLVVSSLEIKR